MGGNSRKINKKKRNNNTNTNTSTSKGRTDHNWLKEKIHTYFNDLAEEYTMNLDDKFTFGKYKGTKLKFIIKGNPGYVDFLLSKGIITLDATAKNMLIDYMSRQEEIYNQMFPKHNFNTFKKNFNFNKHGDSGFLFKLDETNGNSSYTYNREQDVPDNDDTKGKESYNFKDLYKKYEDFFKKFESNKDNRTNDFRSTEGTSYKPNVNEKLLPAYRYDHLPDRQKYGRILRLSGQVTKETIRQNYKKLILTFHPDKCEQMDEVFKEVALTMFKEIQKAYEYFKAIYSL